MKMRSQFAVCVVMAVLGLGFTGCRTFELSDAGVLTFKAIGHAGMSDAPVLFTIDEEGGSRGIRMTATGAASHQAVSQEQRQSTATKAAMSRAVANLATALKGASIKRTLKVEDMVFAGETVEVQTSTTMENFEVVSSQYDDESGCAEVTIAVRLNGEEDLSGSGTFAAFESFTAARIQAETQARIDAIGGILAQISRVKLRSGATVGECMATDAETRKNIDLVLDGIVFGKPRRRQDDTLAVSAELVISRKRLVQTVSRDCRAAAQR